MDQPIRIPRNQTALMQHLQRLAMTGHYYWSADHIHKDKLSGLIAKWEPIYRLRGDAQARAYRKRTGKASVHLAIHPEFLDPGQLDVCWWMVSTAGKDGLHGSAPLPGPVRDARTQEGRLVCGDYELLQQPKSFTDKTGKRKTMTTWTWRITPLRYREWEALLIERAKQRDRPGVEDALACLRTMPMFAGIRMQVIRLLTETNRMLAKVGGMPVELPRLPVMRMIGLWTDTDGL